MKQIFDWLREQMRLSLNEPQYFHEGEDFYNGIIHAEEIINEAESKWEADCCEWEQEEIPELMLNTYHTSCGKIMMFSSGADKYCKFCGKPIKISEVE